MFSTKKKRKRHKHSFNLWVQCWNNLCVSSPEHDVKTYRAPPIPCLSVRRWDTHFMCLANILVVLWLAWIIDRRREPPAACLFVQDFWVSRGNAREVRESREREMKWDGECRGRWSGWWIKKKKREDEREEGSGCTACRDRLRRTRKDGKQQKRRATGFLASLLRNTGP